MITLQQRCWRWSDASGRNWILSTSTSSRLPIIESSSSTSSKNNNNNNNNNNKQKQHQQQSFKTVFFFSITFLLSSQRIARAMICITMYHLKPPARMPTIFPALRTNLARGPALLLCCCSVFSRTETNTEEDKHRRARNSYKVIVNRLKTVSLRPPLSGANLCPLS